MRIILVILMALIFSRCFEQPDCLINNTNIVKIALKGKTLGKDTTVRFTSIRALWLAENLYSNTASIGNILVPLNLKDTLTTVIFKYETKLGTVIKTKSDTLVVVYRSETRVISPDCGAFLYQKDLNVSETNFTKVRVTTPILLSTVTKNLEIFL